MKCFSCYTSEEKKQEKLLKKIIQKYEDTRALASFANISPIMDGGKKRYISGVEKYGKGNISSQVFTFQELCNATQNFNLKNSLGEGGFGTVYKGHIKPRNIDVAVKRLDINGFQGNREFVVELLILSQLCHPNIVNLVGYCAESKQRILVYEYMANGSLEDHLLNIGPNQRSLDWNTRMRIAVGAAKGLQYLHETANPPVIYRDFKASNILLNESFNPKLSDFGFAKVGPTDGKSHVFSRVLGTYGYCAPEYVATGWLSTMSDVYSFGIVFLEIITGRRVVDSSRPSEEQNLIAWAQPLFRDKTKFRLMADPLLEGNYPEKALYQALTVVAMCLQEEPTTRPLISDVLAAVEYLSKEKTLDAWEDEEEEDEEGPLPESDTIEGNEHHTR